MGKQRRARHKLHIASKASKTPVEETPDMQVNENPIMFTPGENLFAGINIDLSNITNKLNDDTVSVKSFKTVKSERSSNKALSKKDKLKLRKEILMKKIDTLNQLKKEHKLRKKRKNTAIMGDTNPLHDALPSLESLLKSKNDKQTPAVPNKPRGIQKTSKRKKTLIQGVQLYKQILKNKEYQKDSLGSITQHIQAIVQSGKLT